MGAAVMFVGPKLVGVSPGRHWRTELGCVFLTLSLGGAATAQSAPLVLERDGRVISLEPYAANIVRITMSIDTSTATGAPGYGFVAKPSKGE